MQLQLLNKSQPMPSLILAWAAGVPSLHQFRLQYNCSISSMPLYMLASFGGKSSPARISSHLPNPVLSFGLLLCVICMRNCSWFIASNSVNIRRNSSSWIKHDSVPCCLKHEMLSDIMCMASGWTLKDIFIVRNMGHDRFCSWLKPRSPKELRATRL